MVRHPYFDLRLHTDQELAAIAGSDLVERCTLHEWPLSCVQRVTLADGSKFIYKAQYGPTVEADFYAQARSELLIPAQTIYRQDGHVALRIDFIQAPRLADLPLGEAEVVALGRSLLERIAAIQGELPCYLDISSEARWKAMLAQLLVDLQSLLDQDKLHLVTNQTLARIEAQGYCDAVLSAIRSSSGYVHGDLGGDNLFVLPNGYRLIDWQRPLRGPTELDLASLLETMGFDPSKHVRVEILWIRRILTIHWFSQCSLRWFPEGIKTYDRMMAELSETFLKT